MTHVDVSPAETGFELTDSNARAGGEINTNWPARREISPINLYAACLFMTTGYQSSLAGGRYWVRTSDPFHVKEVRYHCANRP